MNTIIWSNFASNRLKDVYDFYKKRAGVKIAKQVIQEIYKSTNRLKEYPASGQIEDNLISLKHEYRYIVSGHTKVIYRVLSDDSILITDVFDTRQNPSRMMSL